MTLASSYELRRAISSRKPRQKWMLSAPIQSPLVLRCIPLQWLGGSVREKMSGFWIFYREMEKGSFSERKRSFAQKKMYEGDVYKLWKQFNAILGIPYTTQYIHINLIYFVLLVSTALTRRVYLIYLLALSSVAVVEFGQFQINPESMTLGQSEIAHIAVK